MLDTDRLVVCRAALFNDWTRTDGDLGNVLNRREQVPLEETTTNVVKLDSAGLAVYKDSCRHASLYFDYSTSSVVLSILNWVKDEAAVIKNTAIERPSNIKFKIKTTGEAYTFFCRPREGDWAEIGTMDSIEMTARGFTGPIVGIFAHAKGNAQGQWAVFKNFEQNDGRRGIIHRVL